MTVPIKNKQPIAVPASVLRRAGFKRGQEIEIKVSGGAITIILKLSRDKRQDEREIRDPQDPTLTTELAAYDQDLKG